MQRDETTPMLAAWEEAWMRMLLIETLMLRARYEILPPEHVELVRQFRPCLVPDALVLGLTVGEVEEIAAFIEHLEMQEGTRCA